MTRCKKKMMRTAVVVVRDEGKRRRRNRTLDVNVPDPTVLVKQVIQLAFANVDGKVANVHSGHCWWVERVQDMGKSKDKTTGGPPCDGSPINKTVSSSFLTTPAVIVEQKWKPN